MMGHLSARIGSAINSDGSNFSWILHVVQILKNVKCLKHNGGLLVC
jgi:hypothetical protein